jgi:L-threonylcarbamoyladenylate synthase
MKTCSFAEAVALLQACGVGVLPTDTVYGIVARAADSVAVARLYALKRREHKPGTVIAADSDQLIALGLEEKVIRTVEHLWPNPISLVMSADSRLKYLHQGVGSLAVRVPDDERLRRLLRQTGPLLTSSANQPGEPVATCMEEARRYFGDKVDFYVDGGDMRTKAPSTIARLENGKMTVLREGAVKLPDAARNYSEG